MRLPRSAVFVYGLSILTVGLALLITTLFDPPGRTPAYFLAIVGLTWFYGREVGLFTLALAAVTAAFFTFDPYRSFNLESRDAIQLTTFVIVALATLLLIDALKRRSESLAKSEVRYRTLFEYAPEGFLISDAKGFHLDANASMSRMLGYTRDELIGLTGRDILLGKGANEIVEDALDSIHSGRDYEKQLIFRRKDGSVFPGEVMATKMPDGNLLGVIRDVSEREQSEQRFRQIIEHAPYGKLLVDERGRMQLVNGEIERLFEYSRDELLGRNIEILVPERFRHAHHDYREGYMTGPSPRLMGSGRELFGLRKDGTEFPVEIGLNPLTTDAGVMILATILDLTARKEAEEARRNSEDQLAGIIDSAMDAIVTIDDKQKVVLFNTAAERMFMIDAVEAIGKHIDTFIPERFRKAHQKHVQAFDKTNVTRRDMGPLGVLHGLRSTGEEFPIEASISQIATGGTKLFTVILRDITERRQAEAAIVRLNEDLERSVLKRTKELADANHELESFSYSVSHDLRAPLRHIDGFVQLLIKREAGQLGDPSMRYLNIIHKSVGKMGMLIDELLAFSRTSRQEMKFVPVDLNSLVQEARIVLCGNITDRKITWKVSQLPTVLGDPTLMNVVVMNLLSNAVKYTRGRDEAIIEIGTEPADDDQTTVFFKDNGAGFDMKYGDKLFGVFQRLHRDDEFEGIGIGLATAHRIVSRHGGTIRAKGEVDQGATFHITFRKERVKQ